MLCHAGLKSCLGNNLLQDAGMICQKILYSFFFHFNSCRLDIVVPVKWTNSLLDIVFPHMIFVFFFFHSSREHSSVHLYLFCLVLSVLALNQPVCLFFVIIELKRHYMWAKKKTRLMDSGNMSFASTYLSSGPVAPVLLGNEKVLTLLIQSLVEFYHTAI